jgi:O-antigen ligase
MIALAYAALWIFVFAVPWERIIVLPGVSIVTRVTGMLALALALLAVVTSARVRRLHGFHLAALLFLISAGIGLFNIRMQEIPDKFLTFVQLLLMVWMIWQLAPSRQRVLGLMAAYVFGAYFAAFDTIMRYRAGAGRITRFAAGEADPNDHAMVLALGLSMAWYLGMTTRQPILRWVYRAYLPVAIVVIGLTGSRGGMLAAIVALMVVPLTMTRLSPGRLASAILILGISGAVAVTYVPDRLVERFASTGADVGDLSFGGRFKLWNAGFQAWTLKPLLGYGTTGFTRAVTQRLGAFTQVAHNSFLSVLVEEGLLGFVFYILMFVAVFRSIMQLPLVERRFALVLFGTLIVAMLPLTWEHRKAAWFVLAALAGFSRAQGGGAAAALGTGRVVRAVPSAHPRLAELEPRAASRRNAAT